MMSGSPLVGYLLDAPPVPLQGAPEFAQSTYPPIYIASFLFLSTLVVGGMAIAVAPDSVDRIIDRINENPLTTFGWGVLLSLAGVVLVPFVTIVLIFTLVGGILVVPLWLVVALLVVASNALGYIGIFSRIVDTHGQALVLGAAAAGTFGLFPLVWQIAGFVVGALGIGAMFRVFVE